jgi:hypothetical protein
MFAVARRLAEPDPQHAEDRGRRRPHHRWRALEAPQVSAHQGAADTANLTLVAVAREQSYQVFSHAQRLATT